jgi:epoxyqueuosine reductase
VELLSREAIISKALELGFADVGFTTAETFDSQRELLSSRMEMYEWSVSKRMNLLQGTDPKTAYPEARSVIVLLEAYFLQGFPRSLEGKFGRRYLDDDRVQKDGLTLRFKAFRRYLSEHGVESKFLPDVSHRNAAMRAGLGTFGKNGFFYARAARLGSWVSPLPLAVNLEFVPDQPGSGVDCPDWCKNACIASCPTGALLGPQKIDPRRCISYLSYFDEGLTPRELREPMGMWVYGCDHCQNVCPRNQPWLAQELPLNERVAAIAGDFELPKLLHMDEKYFRQKIWPSMFYVSYKEIWRWHMNVARVMGNSLDPAYVPHLIQALRENPDEKVRAMAAWSLGRIGGIEARNALEGALKESEGTVRAEITGAL